MSSFQNTISNRIAKGEKIDANDLTFRYKPQTISNEEYARTHGFTFSSKSSKRKDKPLNPETVELRTAAIKDKFESDEWKNSKMRDRMYRLRMYSIKQHSFINRDGEETVKTVFPAFNSYEMEDVLNKQRKRFEDTGDPACLHDWKCSTRNGCSEVEMRDTILDLRSAEQTYPEQKVRQKKVYYTTPDADGFMRKVVLRNKGGKGRGKGRRGGKNKGKTNLTDISLSRFKTTNIVDLSEDLKDEDEEEVEKTK